jgi:pyruvate,orthophosphate dikinase
MLDALLHPTFDASAEFTVAARGVAASPGAARGEIVFTAPRPWRPPRRARGHPRPPVHRGRRRRRLHAAKGILTSEGGKASHAALVARGMGVPAVTGASDVDIDLDARRVRISELELHEGDFIAIDGSTGRVTVDDVPLIEPEVSEHFNRVLRWSDELRTLGVRTNADTPEDARRAREFGAEGIGLCRTEHMFFGDARHEKMVAAILADTREERREALSALAPLQQEDFEGIFEAMEGQPVTIRLLDPPLHEFLPHRARSSRSSRSRASSAPARSTASSGCSTASASTRRPTRCSARAASGSAAAADLYEMQAEAIFGAAVAVRERTGTLPRSR